MIEKTCYFFSVGTIFDKNDKEALHDCWNCNQFCCKADLCNGLWCEEYGINFNKKETVEFIKKHVEQGGVDAYGYIKSVNIILTKEEWNNIYKYLVTNYTYSSINDAKKKGYIPYEYTDLIEDYSSYWEEPDISYLKTNNKIKKNAIHIFKEENLNQDIIEWINKDLYNISKEVENGEKIIDKNSKEDLENSMNSNSFYEFEDIYNELKDKKLSEVSTRDIAKYLLVAEELDWVDENIGDDKILYNYDKNLLENLSYKFADSIFRLMNEELLYDNDLHTAPKDLKI